MLSYSRVSRVSMGGKCTKKCNMRMFYCVLLIILLIIILIMILIKLSIIIYPISTYKLYDDAFNHFALCIWKSIDIRILQLKNLLTRGKPSCKIYLWVIGYLKIQISGLKSKDPSAQTNRCSFQTFLVVWGMSELIRIWHIFHWNS